MSTEHNHHTFVCPECRGEISVGPGEKQALIRHGCAVCGSVVTDDAFAQG